MEMEDKLDLFVTCKMQQGVYKASPILMELMKSLILGIIQNQYLSKTWL